MKIRKTKNKFVLVTAVLVLAVYVTTVYAASTFSTSLSFTQTGKYAVDRPITVNVQGAVKGTGILQYLGVAWGKSGEDFAGYKWAEDNPCPKDRCTREITLDGKAGDYKSFKVLPMAWGILDGKLVDGAVVGDAYPIEVEGVQLKVITGPANVKPTVTINVDKPEIFRGEAVKVTVQASASDNDLKSIKATIPSLNREETKPCSNKELGSCKFEFKSALPDAGDIVIEAVAEDLVGGASGISDKATATVKVKQRVNLVKGMNIVKVESALIGKAIMDFGGADTCIGDNIIKVKNSLAWKWSSKLGTVEQDDALIVVYCALTAQESYYDPYFDIF